MYKILIEALLPEGRIKRFELFTSGEITDVLDRKVPNLVAADALTRGYLFARINVYDPEGNIVDKSVLDWTSKLE